MSVIDNQAAPGLTFMGGFDVIPEAHDVVTERHGFPPHLCDATAFYADPGALYVADVVGTGAPCQGSSFAPHLRRSAESDADDPRNAHYVEQVHLVTRGTDVAVFEYLSDVKKVRSTSPSSPNAHRAPGWRHEGMLANFASYGWRVFEYDLNARFRGSAGARRRLYSMACSERAVQAAMRVGVERPEELTPVPFRDRLVMRDIMLDDAMIEGYRAYLYTGHVLSVPALYGDARDQRQVARIDTGSWETEPVGDVRLPAMPMKCFGGTPLVMLEDGRVRRLLLSEFAAIGQVPWSVGHGI